MTTKDESQIKKMVKDKNCSFDDVAKKFPKIPKEELA